MLSIEFHVGFSPAIPLYWKFSRQLAIGNTASRDVRGVATKDRCKRSRKRIDATLALTLAPSVRPVNVHLFINGSCLVEFVRIIAIPDFTLLVTALIFSLYCMDDLVAAAPVALLRAILPLYFRWKSAGALTRSAARRFARRTTRSSTGAWRALAHPAVFEFWLACYHARPADWQRDRRR